MKVIIISNAARLVVRQAEVGELAEHDVEPDMNRRILCVTGLVAITATLAGCDTLGVALGLRMRLDKTPVTQLTASLTPDASLAPGGHGALVLTATTADGTAYTTEGAGRGRVIFGSFTFTPVVVTVKDGTVSLPADPRQSDGRTPHLVGRDAESELKIGS